MPLPVCAATRTPTHISLWPGTQRILYVMVSGNKCASGRTGGGLADKTDQHQLWCLQSDRTELLQQLEVLCGRGEMILNRAMSA